MELHQRLEWRGRRVAWGRVGTGPAVVFCHGTPWSSDVWQPFADALTDRFTVYLWDMPGYGRSSMDAEHAVDLGVQGELLADLLGHWGLDRPHVVAHDYGGAVSLRAHLLHGVAFASLCLVDVVALRPWGSPFFSLVKQHADVFAQLPPAVHRGAVQADERFTGELEDRLIEVAVPTRIVWGEEDTWIPPDRAEQLHRAIPGSTVTTIPGAGHLVQLDQPVRLATELQEWLSRSGFAD